MHSKPCLCISEKARKDRATPHRTPSQLLDREREQKPTGPGVGQPSQKHAAEESGLSKLTPGNSSPFRDKAGCSAPPDAASPRKATRGAAALLRGRAHQPAPASGGAGWTTFTPVYSLVPTSSTYFGNSCGLQPQTETKQAE